MTQSLTKTWTWDANTQGWNPTAPRPGYVTQWNGKDGDPAPGCLAIQASGANHHGGPAWQLAGTWESVFGVPAGSTVRTVGAPTDAFHYRVAQAADPGVLSTGSGWVNGTDSYPLFTYTELLGAGPWATQTAEAGVPVPVQVVDAPSATAITVGLWPQVETGSSPKASVLFLIDTLTLTVTYEPAGPVSC